MKNNKNTAVKESRKNKPAAQPRQRKTVIELSAPPASTLAFQLWEKVKSFGRVPQKAVVVGDGTQGVIDELATALAMRGIERHLYACRRAEVQPDIYAMEEIIRDARHGRVMWANIN